MVALLPSRRVVGVRILLAAQGETMKAYKLFKQRKNGTIGPLFINRRQVIPTGKWLDAEEHPTKGYTFRPGWHTTNSPKADHLSMRGRIWMEVEIKDYEKFARPKNQGGMWYIANKMKVIKPVKGDKND